MLQLPIGIASFWVVLPWRVANANRDCHSRLRYRLIKIDNSSVRHERLAFWLQLNDLCFYLSNYSGCISCTIHPLTYCGFSLLGTAFSEEDSEKSCLIFRVLIDLCFPFRAELHGRFSFLKGKAESHHTERFEPR